MNATAVKLLLMAFFVLGVTIATAKDNEKKPDVKKEGDKKPEMKKDEKKPEEKKESEAKSPAGPPDKPADWSKFPKFTTASGEIVKITETAITVRNKVPYKDGKQTKVKDEDHEYTWHENGFVRREKLPKFTDDKGLERPAKSSEIEKLKKPVGVVGYHMDRSELKTGDMVELELVRPQSITASKVKIEDLTIKMCMMKGENPRPSKPIIDPKKK